MNHTGREYVNPRGYTTNNVENFFLQFKRGMRGTYIHCGEQHVQRYLDEFGSGTTIVLASALPMGNGRRARCKASKASA